MRLRSPLTRPARATRRAVSRHLGTTPGAVFGLCVVFAFVLSCYSVLVPTYQSPDEPQHVDLVRQVASGGGWPAHGSRQISRQVTATLPAAAFGSVLPDGLAAAEARDRTERRSYESLGPDVASDVDNRVTQHPPAYHHLAAGWVETVGRALPGPWPVAFDRYVVVLRMLGVLLLAPLPLWAYHAARRSTGSEPVALTAAVLPLGVPELAHSGASVGGDALLIAACSALAVPVAGVLRGDRRLATAGAVAALTGVALLTRGLALAVVPAVALAYGLQLMRSADRSARHRSLASGALALGGALAVGGWWWVRDALVDGVLLPPGGERLVAGDVDPALGGLGLAWRWVELVGMDSWGLLGWNDVPLLTPVVAVAAVLWLAGGAAALAPGRGARRRTELAVLLVPVGVLGVALAARTWVDHQATGALPGAQGRHLLVGIGGVLVAVAAGWCRMAGRWERVVPLGALVWALGMQAAAMLSIVGAYWTPPDAAGAGATVAAAVGGVLAWSPWNPGPTVALLVGTVVGASLVAVDVREITRPVRPRGRGTAGGPAPRPAHPSLPEVSVVVPVHRGGEDLTRCLDAVAALDPAPAEVLVVADGADHDDLARARRPGITLLSVAGPGGPARARNVAARQARGDVLLFLDADVVAATDVVGRVAHRLRDHPEVDALIGSYDDAPAAPNLLSQYKNLQNHYVHQHARREGFTFWAGCGAVRTATFRSLGGFDESFGVPSVEDIELGYRLTAAGGRIHVLPDLQVTHLKRWGLRSLFVSDVFRRALPWSALILRTGRMEDDLNVDRAGRLRVALACAAVAAGAAIPWVSYAAATSLTLLAALVASELPLLAFYTRARGVGFALRILPWQVFFHVYCGAAFSYSVAAHLVRSARGPAAAAATPRSDEPVVLDATALARRDVT